MDVDQPLTPEQLDRERLVTYLDWAEAEIPPWWLVAYGALMAGWIASYDLGAPWNTVGALLCVVGMVVLLRSLTARTGVSTPRFRGMPAALRRTYALPAGVAVAALAGVLGAVAALDDPPFALLGLAVGVALALSLAWQGRRCRVVAHRLAVEAGIDR